jgi:valyl-tRNA synthetase
MQILVPMAGLIDVAAERTRLAKNRDRATGELRRVTGKLANERFVANAPADVVARERDKQAALEQEVAQLDAQLQRLAALEAGPG